MAYFFICLTIVFFIVLISVILFYKFKILVRIEYFNWILSYEIYVVMGSQQIELKIGIFNIQEFVLRWIQNTYKSENINIHKNDTVIEKILALAVKVAKRLLTKKKITYDLFNANIQIGAEEVTITAIFYGVLCTILSSLSVVLKYFLKVNSLAIDIQPNFRQKMVCISIKCILKIKMVDIIISLLNKK